MTEPTPPEPTGTGHDEVDAALAALADATDRPPAEQIEAYEAVHRTLQETLRGIEQA